MSSDATGPANISRYYKVAFVDESGEVQVVREILAFSDDDAIEQTAAEPFGGAMEIWRDEEMVWQFDPSGTKATP